MIAAARLVALSAVLLGLAGCGGSSSSPQPTAPSSPSSSHSHYKPPPQPKLPPGDPAPRALRGTWVATNNHALSVTLTGRIYSVNDSAGPVRGRMSFHDNTVSMLTAICSLGIGHYHWSLNGGRLAFREIKKDPCINRSGLFVRTFKKS